MMLRFSRNTIMAALLLGTMLLVGSNSVVAQNDPMNGTTVEPLGGLEPSILPGWNLVMLRITMEPGAAIPAHMHPGPVVVLVQSGVFETHIVDGSGTITRATQVGTPAATETAEAGGDFTLNAGDSLAYDEAVVHTMVSAGDEPLVLLVSAVLENGKPGFMFMEGTPTA